LLLNLPLLSLLRSFQHNPHLILRVKNHAMRVPLHDLLGLAPLMAALVVAPWVGATFDNLLSVLAPLHIIKGHRVCQGKFVREIVQATAS